MSYCAECKKETINPKFCSSSCAASFNNKIRKRQYNEQSYCNKCKKCGKDCKKTRIYCNECRHFRGLFGNDLTMKEASYKNGKKCNANTLIRFRARNYAINVLEWDKCEKCGYDKHIEIAHKKPVCEFDENTLISVINHPDNLMALCPNCHWEFDHPIKTSKKRKSIAKIKTSKCENCEIDISSGSKKCKQCFLKSQSKQKKIDWPPLKEILLLLDTNSYRAVGRLLGVSGNAIRKHINKERTENGGSR